MLILRPLAYSIFDALGKKEEFASILEKVCEAQKAFAVEEDSLVYVLKIFAKKQVQPRKMSGFELHKNLLQIANEDMFDIPEFRAKYKSVKSLTRRIANIKGNISNDVKITIYKERANQKSYKVELMDKDFELPPTNDSTFANGMEKAKNMTKTFLVKKGVKMNNDLLNVQEAASYLHISISTLYRWVNQKKIKHAKIGSRVLFSNDYLKEFINNNTVNIE